MIRCVRCKAIRQLEILPFHHYGESKYKKLQKGYELKACPRCDPDLLKTCVDLAEDKGFEVMLGE
jgi:pyruvate-formate lyase-activating enzyme